MIANVTLPTHSNTTVRAHFTKWPDGIARNDHDITWTLNKPHRHKTDPPITARADFLGNTEIHLNHNAKPGDTLRIPAGSLQTIITPIATNHATIDTQNTLKTIYETITNK